MQTILKEAKDIVLTFTWDKETTFKFPNYKKKMWSRSTVSWPPGASNDDKLTNTVKNSQTFGKVGTFRNIFMTFQTVSN